MVAQPRQIKEPARENKMRRKLVAQSILIILSSLCPLCVKAQDYIYDGKRVSGQFVEGMKLVNQAKAYLEDNKIEQAVAAAQRSVELAPESALTHLALGGAKARSGDLETGIEECKKAIAIDPTRPEMWMSLGNIYQADGKGSEALETLRQYLKRFPHDVHYNFIKSQVAIIEREQSTRPSGSSANGEDYFADATKRGIVKWVPARMPLSVYIEPRPPATKYNSNLSINLIQPTSSSIGQTIQKTSLNRLKAVKRKSSPAQTA